MSSQQTALHHKSRLKTMLVAGVGNIGSGLAPMLARMKDIDRMVLVDPDVYEAKNLACQDIDACDVGGQKAVVQADRLRRINPALDTRALCARVEDLPLGELCVDAIMSCLDSRSSRRHINQAAWRLGVPWIDGAVDAAGLLARVNVYRPGPDAPCLECGWDDEDYATATLEQPYPCEKGGAGTPPTNAPASLGLVAAGMMAIECQKLLADDESLLAGRQVMLDLRHHTHYVTAFRRGRCRFDHEMWQVEPLDDSPAQLTLGEAVRRIAEGWGPADGCTLRVEGQHFAAMHFCPACGHHLPVALCLAGRVSAARRRCPECHQTMLSRGFDQREWIDTRTLRERELARPLSALGVEPRDVLSVRSPAGERHFLLGASAAEVRPVEAHPVSDGL